MAKKKKKDKEKKLLQKQAQIAREIPLDKIKGLLSLLSTPSLYKDPASAFMLQQELKDTLQLVIDEKGMDYLKQVDKNMGYGGYGAFGVDDLFSLRAQGTSFFQATDNPWEVFAYLAENYWPMQVSLDELSKAIAADGWYPVGNEANFKALREKSKEFKLNQMLVTLCIHAKTYGNWWIWKKKSILGSVTDLEILLPRFLRPIYNPQRTAVAFYYYDIGDLRLKLSTEEVLHGRFKPSHNSRVMGAPPVGSVLVDIEADMKGSMYNNLVMEKGGLYGLAVLMDSPKQNVPGQSHLNLMKQMEAEFRANHAGAKSAYETVFLTGAKEIKQLAPLSEMDGAFHKTSDKGAKQTAKVIGVPFEYIVDTTTHEQYHAAKLEDFNILRFDMTINEVTESVYSFANNEIVPLWGIKDVALKAKKRYNAMTKAASETILNYAKVQGFMSIDEGRTEIAKLPAFGGKEGQKPLQLNPTSSATLEGLPVQGPVPVPVDEQDQIDSQ